MNVYRETQGWVVCCLCCESSHSLRPSWIIMSSPFWPRFTHFHASLISPEDCHQLKYKNIDLIMSHPNNLYMSLSWITKIPLWWWINSMEVVLKLMILIFSTGSAGEWVVTKEQKVRSLRGKSLGCLINLYWWVKRKALRNSP